MIATLMVKILRVHRANGKIFLNCCSSGMLLGGASHKENIPKPKVASLLDITLKHGGLKADFHKTSH